VTHRGLRWLLLLLPMACAGAAGAAAPSVLASEPIRITFTLVEGGVSGPTGSDAFLDVGHVSAGGARGRAPAITITRRVSVKLEGAAATARVSVALLADTAGVTVRVDGGTLSTVPRLIDPVHRVGSAVVHQIEMIIPAGVPAGTFMNNLQWLAETD
jgi:hypothetical protein